MSEKQLYEIRARKAKFGFKGSVHDDNFVELGEILRQVRLHEPDVLFELNFNMGANEFKLYTNNPNIAEFIRERTCVMILN